MLILIKATALIMLCTFAIGMCVAFITNELGVLFSRINLRKSLREKNKV